MSKLKKVLLMCTAYVLVAALAIGGTIAYLQDTDSDVNVMTLGNVSIEQHEYERGVNTDGAYETVTTNRGTGYKLVEFTQDKPLLPAVGSVTGWDRTRVYFEQFGEGHEKGVMDVLDGIENVQDKFVFVENTGKSDAYVRTLIAYEAGSKTVEEWEVLITHSDNAFWKISTVGLAEINGNNYVVLEYLYDGNYYPEGDEVIEDYNGRHPDGIVHPGDYTYNSLAQVYMNSIATNEDCEALDGNKNGTYDILVLSQAVQAEGFADAKTALDAAFGKSSEKAAEWFGGVIAEHSADTWDGTADTSWYNDTATEFTITTAEQIAGLAELVNDGNTFEGKNITLSKDLDFEAYDANGERISLTPIGSYAFEKAFKGTFDGQNYTISNVYQNGWALENGLWDGDDCGMGLFGLVEDATIKDINITGMELSSEANLMGSIAGAAYGECTFENITVSDTAIGNHSYYSGGIVGWASGDHKYVNCDLDETVVIASQWGDFNNANGGIIGGAGSNGTFYMEDCDVACVIDAFNDVTSAYEWYAYRNAGMLIGRTGHTTKVDDTTYAAAPNLTCVNCTVTYGDWANYTYCEFNAMNYPWVRVQEGYSTHAYGNARYDYATDANGNNVVDENHVHNDGEEHDLLIVFDQLYGGAQGGVYGTSTHDGVTIIYNNK